MHLCVCVCVWKQISYYSHVYSLLTLKLLQGKVADMYTRLCASRAYVYAVAQRCDQGTVDSKVIDVQLEKFFFYI